MPPPLGALKAQHASVPSKPDWFQNRRALITHICVFSINEGSPADTCVGMPLLAAADLQGEVAKAYWQATY